MSSVFYSIKQQVKIGFPQLSALDLSGFPAVFSLKATAGCLTCARDSQATGTIRRERTAAAQNH